jgi:hypothetical protein
MEPGTLIVMSSSTRAPAIPNDFRASSCAQRPPKRPKALPITATGLSEMALSPKGRDAQSIAFLSTAGMVPLCSGVITSTASLAAIASRNATADGGTAVGVSMSSL